MPRDRRLSWFSGQNVNQNDLIRDDDAGDFADAELLAVAGVAPPPYVGSGCAPSVTGSDLSVSVASGDAVALHQDPNAGGTYPWAFKVGAGSIDLTGNVPVGSARWVAVCAKWTPTQSGQTVDDTNATVYAYLDAGSSIVAVAGTEGGGRPTIPVDCVCIADVYLPVGATAITRANLDDSRARSPSAKRSGGTTIQIADLAATKLDNCRPYVVQPQAQPGNGMKVAIRAGNLNVAGTRIAVAGQQITIAASPTGGHHRIALVYVDATGTIQVDYGAEVVYVSTAQPPSFEGRFPLATFDVLDTTTVLDPTPLNDVRPMMSFTHDVPNRFKFVAAGGETAVTITGWTFIVGAHALLVHKNGLLLAESAYTENSDGTGIHGLTALSAADVVELVAPRVAGANPVTAHAATHGVDGADPFQFTALDGLVHASEIVAYDDTHLTVKRFSAVVGGVLRQFDNAHDSPGGNGNVDCSGLGASSWNYLYAYWTGSAVAFVVSPTAPDTNRRTKSCAALSVSGQGNATYLAPIRVTSSGKVRAFQRNGRRTRYVVNFQSGTPDGTPNNLLMFGIGGSSAPTLESLVEALPPHSTMCDMAFYVTSDPGQYAAIAGGGPATNQNAIAHLLSTSPAVLQYLFGVPVDSNQRMTVINSSNSLNTAGFVTAFED